MYYFLNDFDTAAEVEGIRFEGIFAAVHVEDGAPRETMSIGATTLLYQGKGVENALAKFASPAKENDAVRIVPERMPEAGWPVIGGNVEAFARVKSGGTWTGFPIEKIDPEGIRVKDYPLPHVEEVEVLAVTYGVNG